ncbi:MAG: exo-alpha-sialidase [Ruminococcus sp.]|nr:exo-alpha-sialidase [Candidatus Apopatosoma intestinale]
MKTIGREVLFLNTSEGNPRNGESTFLREKDGSVLFVYTEFCGESRHDHARARLSACRSSDGGETWSEPFVLLETDGGAQNIMSPSLLRLADGRMGLVYLCKTKGGENKLSCIPYFRVSDDEGKTWSERVKIIPDEAYYVVVNDCAAVLKNGRILVPVSRAGNGDYTYLAGKVLFYASDDNGKTWQKLSGEVASPHTDNIGLQEPGVFEREDGTLWSWFRTGYGFQYQSFSSDGGQNWSAPVPNWFFTSPDSPMRVKNVGAYTVAVYNPVPYCGVGDRESWGSPKRTPLVCAVSRDDGLSFQPADRTTTGRDTDAFCADLFYLEESRTDSYCYPSILGLDDGFLVSYYHSGGSSMCLNCTKIVKVRFDEIG